MKWVSTIVVLLIGMQGYSGVGNDDKRRPYNIGINTNVIVGSLFKIGDNSIYNPYLADARFYFQNNCFFSVGLGGYNRNKTDQLDGFADKAIFDDWALDLRIGLGWKEPLSKSWILDYGFHVTTHLFGRNTIIDSGFDKFSDINQGFTAGGGPFLSFSYLISDRFSIRSESAFYYVRGITSSAKVFQSVPGSEDTGKKTITNDIKTFLPINLYITFHL
jgi:hypothetical protein